MMLTGEQSKKGGEIVAYGFCAEEDRQTGVLHNRFIQLFTTATDARRALACAMPDVQVLICDRHSEVSPLNLAAALHKDSPLRDIYLEKTDPQSLFVSRVEAAGARGVVSKRETERLLGLATAGSAPRQEQGDIGSGPGNPEGEQAFRAGIGTVYQAENQAPASATARSSETNRPALLAPAASPEDLAWLEYVLELDDIDGFSAVVGAGPALAEKPRITLNPVQRELPAPKPVPVAAPEPEGKGVVAAFISGRGGVGKSSLTVLTAIELWLAGSRVAMLDMDLQFGDVGVLAGNEAPSRIQRLGIEQLCNNRMKLPTSEGSLLLVEAPRNPELAEELVHQIPELLAALRRVADIVLINTGCLWNEAAAVLASSADRLIICMDQRATSVSAARQVVELCVRLQIPSTRLCYLLNRCARNAPITDIDASLAMGGVTILTIAEGGMDVDELLSLGCPCELLSAQAPLRQSIQKLGACLLGQPGDAPAKSGGQRR
ncbi:MAG: P-loop NTPase [Coriobacteriales bacterium]|jgi:MinD-like ATPase involved in chromosome partitioning or flagellar assembly|nr:P-loop NTPase [Coriobacteriales bacterium]